MTSIFYGGVINPASVDTLSVLPRCLICLEPSGNIAWIIDDVEPSNLQDDLAAKGLVDMDNHIVTLKDGEFIIPGFIDTHTHAPQYPNTGTGGQYELLDWLQNVTFPTESRFSDPDFAQRTYQSTVRRALDAGTTTSCYYGTLHLNATKILADVVHSLGQRAFIGKCSMNRNAPDYYVEKSAEASVDDVRELIDYIQALPEPSALQPSHEPRVQPIITPRFAISCTDDLLTKLGDLAASQPNIRIQTHISENPSEVSYVRDLFPRATNYAEVYDMFGLLRNNTILAHAVHLSQDEMDLIKAREAGISHCPTSNFNLSSGVAPVGKFLDMDMKVGLGTDVSGGYSISILNAIQNASIASKILSISNRDSINTPTSDTTTTTTARSAGFANKPLSIPALLYLATVGGAKVCGLENQLGDFKVGKSFDALIVSIREEEVGNPALWGIKSDDLSTDPKALLELWLERFMFCGDDRSIREVYVQGRLVGGKAFHNVYQKAASKI